MDTAEFKGLSAGALIMKLYLIIKWKPLLQRTDYNTCIKKLKACQSFLIHSLHTLNIVFHASPFSGIQTSGGSSNIATTSAVMHWKFSPASRPKAEQHGGHKYLRIAENRKWIARARASILTPTAKRRCNQEANNYEENEKD